MPSGLGWRDRKCEGSGWLLGEGHARRVPCPRCGKQVYVNRLRHDIVDHLAAAHPESVDTGDGE